jgi:PKHD-type hydroxylase
MTNNTPDTETNFTDAAAFSPATMASLDIVSINKSKLFSKEECDTILSTSCIEELWLPSTVVGNTNFHQSKRQKLRGDTAGFPFLNIRDVTKNANIEIYDFSLLGIIDQDFPQVFKYSETDFYKMHVDLNPMAPSRKLTFIINLSDPAECTGGNIEFLNVDTTAMSIEEQGSCLIFPSYTPYSISPITVGSKYFIIGHVHGALFK